MKTKEDIKNKIAYLKTEKAMIEENRYVLTEVERIDLECIFNEIAVLKWVLN